MKPLIGCAGWSVPREYSAAFPAEGTHLQRYASRFGCVEINSSFYRPHRLQTYVRWADSVPEGFRFSVKIPKAITHTQRLQDSEALLDEFLAQCAGLGEKLGCLLVQLPPSLMFESDVAHAFFDALRTRFSGPVVLEPRHESWVQAESLLQARHIAQAAVDPSRLSTDSRPRGWQGFSYWRLHGSPKVYHDAYGVDRLQGLAQALVERGVPSWCVFDNTAGGAAVGDGLTLGQLLGDHR